MANVTPTVTKILQSYGGLKEVYFEVTGSANDVIVFDTKYGITGVKMVNLQNASTGAAYPATATGTDNINVKIGTGPSSTALIGRALFRSY